MWRYRLRYVRYRLGLLNFWRHLHIILRKDPCITAPARYRLPSKVSKSLIRFRHAECRLFFLNRGAFSFVYRKRRYLYMS